VVSIHLKALSMRPPRQPWFPLWEHWTSSSSLRDTRLPLATKLAPSTEPVVEKAQHEPHRPWFFTGVTAPFATQSTAVGAVKAVGTLKVVRGTLKSVAGR